MEDIEVIQTILSGRGEAYADLVRKYQGRILQLCESMLSDTYEAEDAAQEIFIKAYQSLKNFRGASSFSTYLYRIAANYCRDLLREKSRRKTESWEALLEKADDRLMRLLSAPPDANLMREDAEIIERVLSLLSPEYRMVLTLREIQELRYQEIAEVMHCSLDSVKARLRRARLDFEEKLRHFLGPGNV
jgi:RNA polymerase sigma-70 factor (ECF subfamily)